MADILKTEALAQDINFVTKFDSDLHNLLAVLGKTEVTNLAPGAAFKIYPTSGELSEEAVPEKGLIPDSGIETGEPTIVEITYQKYRNLTSIEQIGKYGYDLAVRKTNDGLLRRIQNKIRKSIYAAIGQNGIAVVTAGANATFQMKIAKAAAAVTKKFEDEEYTPVFFVNTDDLFDYLGAKEVTLETQFGLTYIKNFMGLGDVVVDSEVPVGAVYGTAKENLDAVAAEIPAIPGLDLTTDETGIIAVHNGAKYENAALETVAYCGLAIQPVYLDRIFKVTAGA